jgi:hypothetical protein
MIIRRAIRKTRITRKSLMVKPISSKSGTRMRRAPTPIMMVWPLWLLRAPTLLQEKSLFLNLNNGVEVFCTDKI